MGIGWGSSRMSGGINEGYEMRMIWVVALLALAGCNTVAGVGQDISSGASHVAGMLGG